MAVKPRKAKTGGRAQVEIRREDSDGGGEEFVSATEAVPYPTDGSPNSQVRVAFGKKISKVGTYSSAAIEIDVSIPCMPGQEQPAGDVAMAKALEIYDTHEEMFEGIIDSL